LQVACCTALLVPALACRAATDPPPAGNEASTPTASDFGADTTYARLRGLEEVPKEGGAPYPVARALLFLPRTLLDALTFSMAYGAYVGTESSVPKRVEEILTFDQGRFGIHPLLSVSSGSRAEFGAEVAYRVPGFGASVSGLYGNSENWGAKLDVVSEFKAGGIPFKILGTSFINERDGFEFHGFGPSPQTDPRNQFLQGTGAEFVDYDQRLTRTSVAATARPWTIMQFFYTGLYQERAVSDFRDDHGVSVDNNPATNQTSKQFYQEVGFRFDTRKYERKITPGFRLEAYAGLSNGVGNDQGRFRRLGVDVAPYVPVLKRDRILVPRFILDTVDDLNEDQPLIFTDYPRQPTFRGASRTQLLRTDLFSAVPSLEYRWPLTHNVSGHLFIDYLMVGDSVRHLTFHDAPYAYGVGIAIQGARSEVGRIAVSGGSEGVRLMIDLGLTTHVSDRTRWL
jgi:hypothetical protein